MITFTCRNITNNTVCTGHVRYTAGPVQMVAMFEELKAHVDAAKVSDGEVATHGQFKTAVSQIMADAAKKKTTTRTKIIYLTCDAEAMHVESYQVPVKE